MTSWTRGKENEERGNRELSDNDASDNLQGISDKVGGLAEQGADNVKDTLKGRQSDLKGEHQNYGERAGEWVEDRGKDIRDTTT